VCTSPNTCFLGAHLRLKPKRHVDRFSSSYTAHGEVSSGMPGHAFSPKNYPFAWSDLDPHLTVPLAHPSPNPKRHLERFNRLCTAHGTASIYFTMGRPFPPQNCPFPREIWTPFNRWLFWPIRTHNRNGISIGSAVFAGLTAVQTDRPSDHAVPSVTLGRIYVRNTAMRPNNAVNKSGKQVIQLMRS